MGHVTVVDEPLAVAAARGAEKKGVVAVLAGLHHEVAAAGGGQEPVAEAECGAGGWAGRRERRHARRRWR